MNDPTDIRRRYRQFADRECKGYSDLYYRLALAVSEDDDVISFLGGMPVAQPNLFLASIQFLTGLDRMPKTGAELAPDADERGWTLRGLASRPAVRTPGARRGRSERGIVPAPRPVLLRIRSDRPGRGVLVRSLAVRGDWARAPPGGGAGDRLATWAGRSADQRARGTLP